MTAGELFSARMFTSKRSFLYILASLHLATADITFTKPAAGEVIRSTTLEAAWKESGQMPAISTFESFSLFLCAGGNNGTDFVGHPGTYFVPGIDIDLDTFIQSPTICDL